ncbi:hypothetical protein MKQ70_16650 [Chitinophaga sedimenti]|uniref:hypothetical protein n=1 Tax=Chitinophaga sedimenti TaxID=2033606 RepID=UPI0020045207|nr:hypothetical protein [Chitinophaga sedimenti]MCK7556558.1 hypothetical protein [Chitinophaga sedimenti]
MKTCFLYNYYKTVYVTQRGAQRQNHLVAFFAYKKVLNSKETIQFQFRNYFFSNTLPDKLIIFCLDHNKADVVELFKTGSTIFDYIPKFRHDEENGNIVIVSLGLTGTFNAELGNLTEPEIREIYNRGMTKIFVDNGGLIVSRSAHHFVFPSGKHCDRFLRTGNVLLHGAQITFLASALLLHFKNRAIQYIFVIRLPSIPWPMLM